MRAATNKICSANNMSYEINISRGYRWSGDGSYSPIPLDEWNRVIDALLLERVELREATNPRTGEVMRMTCPNSAMVSTDGPMLMWRDGDILICGSPDTIPACRAVADALSAGIFGEEGETY